MSACSSRDVKEGIQAAENSGERVGDGVVSKPQSQREKPTGVQLQDEEEVWEG